MGAFASFWASKLPAFPIRQRLVGNSQAKPGRGRRVGANVSNWELVLRLVPMGLSLRSPGFAALHLGCASDASMIRALEAKRICRVSRRGQDASYAFRNQPINSLFTSVGFE